MIIIARSPKMNKRIITANTMIIIIVGNCAVIVVAFRVASVIVVYGEILISLLVLFALFFKFITFIGRMVEISMKGAIFLIIILVMT